MVISSLVSGLGSVQEEESLFARDDNDQLIVRERASRERFKKVVTITIDGYEVTVSQTTPMTDAFGNVVKGEAGLPNPRVTTIYDAAKHLADSLIAKGEWGREELSRRIPVLCHRDHLDPVAVCRICSVHVSRRRNRDGHLVPGVKLVPACQHEVRPEMIIITRAGWDCYNPKEKDRLIAERKELMSLPALMPCEVDGELLTNLLSRLQTIPGFGFENETRELFVRIDARLQILKSRKIDEQSELATEKAALADLNSANWNEKDIEAMRRWLERARQVLGISPVDHCRDLLEKANARLRSILDLERAVEAYSNQTNATVCLLIELLLVDHLHTDPTPKRYENELKLIATRLGIDTVRSSFQHCKDNARSRNYWLNSNSRPINLPVIENRARVVAEKLEVDIERKQQLVDRARNFPYSSRSIQVDHDRCIQCDRCVRSCSDVRPFKIIGHTGKGYRARISFDLDRVMNDSNCVQCGECMTACPTGALALNRRVVPKPIWEVMGITSSNDPRLAELADPDRPLPSSYGFFSAEEMQVLKLRYIDEKETERNFYPFAGIPFAFLRWNEGAVRRRYFQRGAVICHEGDFGSTAFLLEQGEIEVWIGSASGQSRANSGFLARHLDRSAPARNSLYIAKLRADEDLIAGEAACLTNTAHRATLIAAGNVTILEVTRNMLQLLQRAPNSRAVLDRIYRRRTIATFLRTGALFLELTPADRQFIGDELLEATELHRVQQGEVIVAQGDREGDFYVIRLGFVKVVEEVQGQQSVLSQLGPDDYFGELGVVSDDPEVERAAKRAGLDPNIRATTVSALSDVEVVRVPRDAFRKLLMAYPVIEGSMVHRFVESLARSAVSIPLEKDRLGEFQRKGLFQSQNMLVLDLVSCTRCDECTKACADSHKDGHSRLLRVGKRFGDFLVATSCRSCYQPYCMEDCPVDAIHRKGTGLEVLVEDHCIGCGLCERNCPFGAIQMVPKQTDRSWSDLLADVTGNTRVSTAAENPQVTGAVTRRAVNCDLCHGLVKPGQDPFCVSACPHNSAFRWSGKELFDEVKRRS